MLDETRRDQVTSQLVNEAIQLDLAGQRLAATALLTHHRLPESVIARVLREPERRRRATHP